MLLDEESTWPAGFGKVDEEVLALERKKLVNVTAASIVKSEPRFSSYLKNVRVASWIRRFVDNCRIPKPERNLTERPTLLEMKRGELDLIFEIQKNHFRGKPNMSTLNAELKEDRLWHVRTRITNKTDVESFKSPILLPKDDPIVHQLVEYVHRTNCHVGTQITLGIIRERYWIPSGRKTVGRIIQKCVVCKRFTGKRQEVEAAPLPQPRVETVSSFQTTGVDLAGPIILKGGKKVWIVLYTCAVYRGLYLDLVDSLSTQDFLDSLEKFTWTIGRPTRIYSDNGTNFVGAQSLLKQLNWSQLESKLQVKSIEWTFNPPTAAWWGGWWERLVRSVKELLRRMVGSAKLTKRELARCLLSLTHTINSRPLTTLTEDQDDLEPLTPEMFMRDLPVTGLPERELITDKDLKIAYSKLQNIRQSLTDRFRREYLANLVQMKSEKPCTLLKKGDVVLVGADNKKRYEWPLGKILEVFPGRDGKPRVASVKTKGGILTRPFQRLYPLEVSSQEQIPSHGLDIRNPKEDKEVEEVETTTSGRRVKKPRRYGYWNV